MLAALNDDILDVIFQHCLPSSLATMSQTCSGVYALALPRLVRKVNLQKAHHACIFLQLILHPPAHQISFPKGIAHHVIELWLGVDIFNRYGRRREVVEHPDDPCSQLAPMLLASLQSMTNLRCFDLASYPEGPANPFTDLARTLLNIQSLQSLSLTDTSATAYDALGEAVASMECESLRQVRTLRLLVRSPWAHRPAPASAGFDRFLSSLSPNLVNLDINNIDLSGLLSETASPPVVFPNVLRLRILQCCVSLQELSCAFPNVVNLEIRDLPGGFPERSHHLAHSFFPHLTVAKANFDHLAAIIRSPLTSGQQREIRCLDVLSDHDTVLDLLSKNKGLKSLYFSQDLARPLAWWQRCVGLVPELLSLRISLRIQSLQDFELIGTQLPCAFSSIPLEFVMVELCARGGIANNVDADEFSGHTALLWARSVCTLKHMIVRLIVVSCDMDIETNGLEVVRSRDGIAEVRPIPWDKVSEIEEGYDLWN
ncbi:hypothetical protein BKA70DRAFT_1281026 [Coprinopsis sp. MPI-PUGE-AT-0042]|nr:hypothetical protein BKA70DRAFT_1281026 [Coprinopsis sp. MPI-PUGE-AT-0042]